MYISKSGTNYRKDVAESLLAHGVKPLGIMEPIEIRMILFLPEDRRRHGDLDNRVKQTFDAMEHYGLLNDDKYVKRYSIEEAKGVYDKGGLWVYLKSHRQRTFKQIRASRLSTR